MEQAIIVIIPTALAYCFAVKGAKLHQEKVGMVILFFAMCTLWMHFYAQSVKWFGDSFPDWLSNLRAYTSSLAQPLAFLVVLQAIGKKLTSTSTYVLFSIVLINVIQYGALSLDDLPTAERIDLHNICFLYGGKVVYRIPNYCLVMIIQGIWIFNRTIVLKKMIKENHYHSSSEAKIVLRLLFIMIISVMVCAMLPDGFWECNIARYVFFTYFSISFTALLLLIGKSFILQPILDSNEEPVYFDRKPQFDDMEIKCRKLYEADMIYLTPSLKLEDLARMLDTNRTYAAELMKTRFNSTFAAYTNTLRIEDAKKILLQRPKDKIEDIARLCGFATAPTFTKVFKAQTGLTPTAWLAQQAQEGSKEEKPNIK